MRLALVGCLVVMSSPLFADEHQHGETTQAETVKRPKVFLDKSPRMVQFQLKRLDNRRLLLVERSTGDKKYIPVYEAILARPGMSPQFLEESVAALAKLRKSTATVELLNVITKLKIDEPSEKRAAMELARMLLKQTPASLAGDADALESATDSDERLFRSIGFAGLIASGNSAKSWELAQADQMALQAWLASIRLLPNQKLRAPLYDQVVDLVKAQKSGTSQAAIRRFGGDPTACRKNVSVGVGFFVEGRLPRRCCCYLAERSKEESRSRHLC